VVEALQAFSSDVLIKTDALGRGSCRRLFIRLGLTSASTCNQMSSLHSIHPPICLDLGSASLFLPRLRKNICCTIFACASTRRPIIT